VKIDNANGPESPSKRKFIKKAALGLVLLPYVAPMIESFSIKEANATITIGGKKGKISPVKGDD
jgi:hypothetical protein